MPPDLASLFEIGHQINDVASTPNPPFPASRHVRRYVAQSGIQVCLFVVGMKIGIGERLGGNSTCLPLELYDLLRYKKETRPRNYGTVCSN